MAFDASQDQSQDDEQQKAQANQPGSQNVGQLSAGGGFAGQTGSAAPSSGQATSSGNWTNLNSYLDANRDQSQAVGNTIAGGIGQQAQSAQQNLQNAVTGFQNQSPFIDVNSTTGSQVDSAFKDPSVYGGSNAQSTDTAEKYLNNSWGFTPQTTDITQYNPSSGPGWSGVVGDYNTAAQGLRNTQSEAGRGVLLQDQYGQGGQQYTQGEQAFDQLLLEQNPNNQATLQNLYNQYAPGIVGTSASGTPNDINTAFQGAQSYSKAAQDKAAGFQKQAAGDLGSDISALQGSVTGEMGTANSKYNTDYQHLSADIGKKALTPEEAKALGLPDAPSYNTYGVDVGSYLSPEATNPYTANYAASDSDWNNFSGLQALIGGYKAPGQASAQSALAGVGLTGTQADQASAPPINPYGFNKAGFTSAVNSAKVTLTQKAQDIQSQMDALMAQQKGSLGSTFQNDSTGESGSQYKQQYDELQAQLQYIQNQLGESISTNPYTQAIKPGLGQNI